MICIKKRFKLEKTITNKLLIQKLQKPNYNILQKIRTVNWTSHNIPLTQNESTIDKKDLPLIGNDIRTNVIKKVLYRFVSRNNSLAGLRLIDLGCLEGGIAFEMAREDMEVVGIEGRKSNFLKCQLIKQYFEFPNLNFVHLDVKKINKDLVGVFDVVLCLGLLYHLDNPVSFLEILCQITHDKSIIFLDTHIAPSNQELFDCDFKDKLSDLVQFEYNDKEYEGRWYQEGLEEDQLFDDSWAAVSNLRSFWLTESSLMRALFFSGFKNIFKLYGCFEIDKEFELRRQYSRIWCVAVKSIY